MIIKLHHTKRANNFTFIKHIACRLDQNMCGIMAVATIKVG